MQAGDTFLKTLFRRDKPSCLGGLGFRRCGIQIATPAEHSFFNLPGDDRSNAAEILPNGIDLEDGTHQIFEISRDIAGFDGSVCDSRGKTFPHRMPDEDSIFLLSMTVDATVALFHDIWIPRNLDMDEVVAVVLQVNTFRGRVGREQNANRRNVRMRLERSFDRLALVRQHASMQIHQSIAAVSVGSEYLMEPRMGGPVFGEQNHALSIPVSIRLQMALKPVENGLGFRVDAVTCFLSPCGETVKHISLLV